MDHALAAVVWIWTWWRIHLFKVASCSEIRDFWNVSEMIIANLDGVFLSECAERTVIGKTEIVSRMGIDRATSAVICDADSWTDSVLDERHCIV